MTKALRVPHVDSVCKLTSTKDKKQHPSRNRNIHLNISYYSLSSQRSLKVNIKICCIILSSEGALLKPIF